MPSKPFDTSGVELVNGGTLLLAPKVGDLSAPKPTPPPSIGFPLKADKSIASNFEPTTISQAFQAPEFSLRADNTWLTDGLLDRNTVSLFPSPEEAYARMQNCAWLAEQEGVPLELMSFLQPTYEKKYAEELFGHELPSPLIFNEKVTQVAIRKDFERYTSSPAEQVEKTKDEYLTLMQQPGYNDIPASTSPDGLSYAARAKMIEDRKAAGERPVYNGFSGAYMPSLSLPTSNELNTLEANHIIHARNIDAFRASRITKENLTARAVEAVMGNQRAVDSALINENFRSWLQFNQGIKILGPLESSEDPEARTIYDPEIRQYAGQWLSLQPDAGERTWDATNRFSKGLVSNTASGLSGGIGLGLKVLGLEEPGQVFTDYSQSWVNRSEMMTDPRLRDTFLSQAAEMTGDTASLVLAGTGIAKVGKFIGLGEAGIASATTAYLATSGAANNAQSTYQEALRYGASEKDARLASILGALVGTTDAIPTLRWSLRLAKPTPVLRAITRVALEASQAGAQSAFQNLSNNAIAQQIYDEHRALLDGVLANSAVEGGSGAIVSLLTIAVANGRKQGTTGTNSEPKIEYPSGSQNPPSPPRVTPYRNKENQLQLRDGTGKSASPEEQRVQENFIKLINNTQLADKLYDQLPDSHNGKVIGTDIARDLSPEHKENRDGKIKFTDITSAPAAIFAKDRFWWEISNPKGKRVAFMAGGVGAGKSTVLNKAMLAEYDLVFDGTFRDGKWAMENIDHAVANGWKIDVIYVQRPIPSAVEGVINRAQTTGRGYPLGNLYAAHRAPQQNVVNLAEKYSANKSISFFLYLNEGKATKNAVKKLTLSDIAENGDYHYNEEYEFGRGYGNGEREETSSENRRRGGKNIRELEPRSIEEAFRRAVKSGEIERRILEYLATGRPDLQRILSEKEVY